MGRACDRRTRRCQRGVVRGLLALGVVLASCTEDPLDDLEQIRQAIEAGDLATVESRIHPDYSDALGDRNELAADLARLTLAYGRIRIELTDVELLRGPNPDVAIEIVGRMQVSLSGKPEWKIIAPLGAEYRRATTLRLRSGLLTDVRDIRALMGRRRAALEGNDAEAYASLLHPNYRDGDLDRDDVEARLRTDLTGVRIRHEPMHYRVDVRGPVAHVDERYALTVGDRSFGGKVARLTLERSAGRWRIAGGLYAGGQ